MTTQLRVLWAEQSFSFSSLMRSLVSCSSSILFLFTIIVAISVNFMGTCKLLVITTAFQVTNLFIPSNGKDLSNYHYKHYTGIRPVLHIKGSIANKIKPCKALNCIFETTDKDLSRFCQRLSGPIPRKPCRSTLSISHLTAGRQRFTNHGYKSAYWLRHMISSPKHQQNSYI